MNNAALSAAAIAASDTRDSSALENRPAGAAGRRGPRISIRVPGVLAWREGSTDRVEAVFTMSVSRFGCSLHCRKFFHPGTLVRLEFAEKAIHGRIVHSLKDHSTKLVTLGVAFDHDSSDFWQLGFEIGA